MGEGSRRSLARRTRRRVRNTLVRPLTALALAVLPRLYLGYMKLVWATSRVEANGFERLHEITREHDGAVALLWHEEVFTVAYGYGIFDFNAHTLASPGTSGELITRMLRLCGYVVFRGGSSGKASRRRPGVMDAMVSHMRENRNVTYGITVDGSRGPPYRMKPGGVLIARACGKPLALGRTWCKRSIRLGTWDRTAIPLPFNRIHYYLAGPYHVPDDTGTDEGLQRFLLGLEDELIDIAAQSYRDMGQPLPAALAKRGEAERRMLGAA